MSAKTYDVVVLGGGPGGYVAAIRASQLGLSTAVVEKDNLGGICLNWGCIPTKALLKNAEHARIARTEGAEWGILYDNLRFDFERVIARSRDVSARIVKGVEFLMKKNKIEVHKGTGKLKGKDTVVYENDGKTGEVRFKNLIIATGARPRPFPGVDFDGEKVISYFQAMVPKSLPKKLAIIGGGAIGCEFAYFYNAFGTEVHIFEMLPSLLPIEDKDCTKELARSFKKQGIKVYTGVKTEVSENKDGVTVKAGNKTIEADQVLVSIGVMGNIENLGLETAGIKTERGFIVTDDRYDTNVKGIKAIGDVTGRVMLAHVASHQGTIAAEDIAGKTGHLVDYDAIPSCTYCQPQVASVGWTEEKCKEKGYEILVGKYPFRPHGKAVATGENEGFVKLIFDKKYGELLGAHIVGHEATEMIAEACAAKSSEATVETLAATMHAHPTMSEAFHEATLDALGRAIHL
ncbi:MAG: dihydrolipoyl dehydrogenase [Planctomycetota bacterium]|jgi:dihydrolipoamide dehydrogenase